MTPDDAHLVVREILIAHDPIEPGNVVSTVILAALAATKRLLLF